MIDAISPNILLILYKFKLLIKLLCHLLRRNNDYARIIAHGDSSMIQFIILGRNRRLQRRHFPIKTTDWIKTATPNRPILLYETRGVAHIAINDNRFSSFIEQGKFANQLSKDCSVSTSLINDQHDRSFWNVPKLIMHIPIALVRCRDPVDRSNRKMTAIDRFHASINTALTKTVSHFRRGNTVFTNIRYDLVYHPFSPYKYLTTTLVSMSRIN